MDVVKISRDNGYATVVVYDNYSDSPRDWYNLCKVYIDCRSISITECGRDDIDNARVKLPIYKYQHSGIALSTDNSSYPFNDRFDSCLAGYIVAFDDDIRKWFNVKRITKKVITKVEDVMRSEIELLSQYANGEVYGFEVYKVGDDVPDDEVVDEGELIDSCYGFYSVEDALSDGQACIPAEAMA